MLVLSRGPCEKIVFPNLGITLEILRVQGSRVRIGIQAPKQVAVLREELLPDAGLVLPLESKPEVAATPSQPDWTHAQRNSLHTAQLALQLLWRQLDGGLTADSKQSLQTALRALDGLDAECSAPATNEPDKALPLAPPRALLVEDNPIESELLSGYLRMSGYDVDTADDGLKAIVYLSRHQPPDFVLLDMLMPQVDGVETVNSIRGNPELCSTKIFAVTGKRREETGVVLGPGGVDRWFRKPVNPAELVAAMNRELDGARLPA
jgi:two-component system, OmpR family, response regulator